LAPAPGRKLPTNSGRLLWEFKQLRAEGKKPMEAYRAIARTDQASGSKRSTSGSVTKAVARARKRIESGDISI
jgi:hypothetical protein